MDWIILASFRSLNMEKYYSAFFLIFFSFVARYGKTVLHPRTKVSIHSLLGVNVWLLQVLFDAVSSDSVRLVYRATTQAARSAHSVIQSSTSFIETNSFEELIGEILEEGNKYELAKSGIGSFNFKILKSIACISTNNHLQQEEMQ
jgi:hypothetical protein